MLKQLSCLIKPLNLSFFVATLKVDSKRTLPTQQGLYQYWNHTVKSRQVFFHQYIINYTWLSTLGEGIVYRVNTTTLAGSTKWIYKLYVDVLVDVLLESTLLVWLVTPLVSILEQSVVRGILNKAHLEICVFTGRVAIDTTIDNTYWPDPFSLFVWKGWLPCWVNFSLSLWH